MNTVKKYSDVVARAMLDAINKMINTEMAVLTVVSNGSSNADILRSQTRLEAMMDVQTELITVHGDEIDDLEKEGVDVTR